MNNRHLWTCRRDKRAPGRGSCDLPCPHALLLLVLSGRNSGQDGSSWFYGWSYTTKIKHTSGTPQPFLELTQLAHLAKASLLGRRGHGGAGLVPCLVKQAELVQENIQCMLEVVQDRAKNQTSPFAHQPVIRSVCDQFVTKKEAGDCLYPLFKHTEKSHCYSSSGRKKKASFTFSPSGSYEGSLVYARLNSKGYFKLHIVFISSSVSARGAVWNTPLAKENPLHIRKHIQAW